MFFLPLAFVHNHDQTRSKLDPRSYRCSFLGYSPTQKGYRCYSFDKQKIFTSADVTFFKHQPFFKQNMQGGEFWSYFQRRKLSWSENLEVNSTPNLWEYFWDSTPSLSNSGEKILPKNLPISNIQPSISGSYLQAQSIQPSLSNSGAKILPENPPDSHYLTETQSAKSLSNYDSNSDPVYTKFIAPIPDSANDSLDNPEIKEKRLIKGE